MLIEQARSSGRGFRTHLKAILLAAPTAVSRALTMTVTRIAGCVEYQASKDGIPLGSTRAGSRLTAIRPEPGLIHVLVFPWADRQASV